MLSKVVLDNFRSFAHAELDLSGPDGRTLDHAAVCGENGSGKTSLVESVLFLMESARTLAGRPWPVDWASGYNLVLGRDPDDRDLDGMIARLAAEYDGSDEIRMPRTSMPIIAEKHSRIGSDDGIRAAYEFVRGARFGYGLELDRDGRVLSEELTCRPWGRKPTVLYSLRRGEEPSFHRMFFRDAGYGSCFRDLVSDSWGDHTALSILVSETADDRGQMEGMVCPWALAFLDCLAEVRILTSGSGDLFPDMEWGVMNDDDRIVLKAYQMAASEFLRCIDPDIREVRHVRHGPRGRDCFCYRTHVRRLIDGECRLVPIESESSGIWRALEILPYLMELYRGRTVLVDDADAWLHPDLLDGILEQALDDDHGQLIMTVRSLPDAVEAGHAFAVVRTDGGGREVRPIDVAVEGEGRLDGGCRGIPNPYWVDMSMIVNEFDYIVEGRGSDRAGTAYILPSDRFERLLIR